MLLIDPTAMQDLEKSVLKSYVQGIDGVTHLLLHQNQCYELKINNPYLHQDNIIQFKLTHDLLLRQCNHARDYRCEVFDFNQVVGVGGFSKVFAGMGTLIPEDDSLFQYKSSHYVIKWQHHRVANARFITDNSGNVLSNLSNEIELSKQAGLGIKSPTVVPVNKYMMDSFTVIKRYEGSELFEIILKDREDTPLSTDLRIKLSIELLRSLNTQVHAKGLVHRDIKPENIIATFDENKSQIIVRIIDYGSSKPADKITNDRVGTPGYMSHEALTYQNTDQKTDVYSMAKVLCLLWRAQETEGLYADEPAMLGIFDGIKDISPDHELRIRQLFERMTDMLPENRPSLDDAISVFESLLLERKLAAVTENERVELIKADGVASNLRAQLTAIAKVSPSASHPSLNLKAIAAAFTQALTQLKDTPIVMQDVVDKLDIKALDGLQSKTEIMNKVNSILTSVTTNLNALQQLTNKMSAIEINRNNAHFVRQYEMTLNQTVLKLKHTEFMLDSLVSLNDKLTKCRQKLEEIDKKINESSIRDLKKDIINDLNLDVGLAKMGLFANKMPSKQMVAEACVAPKLRSAL